MKNIEMVFSIKADEGALVNNIAKSAGKAPDALTGEDAKKFFEKAISIGSRFFDICVCDGFHSACDVNFDYIAEWGRQS